MDEGLSDAVKKVFVKLYEDGLIYRDKRLVNWDPHFQTAISDLEVEQKEVQGAFWHLRYPLADGVTYEHPVNDEDGNPAGTETRNFIVVATTRPETMLGDTGVAVHPDDERYASLVGKFVELPIVGRRIPIVADEHADPEKGSGAVKITPAHDFNDFQVGERAGLPRLNILTSVAAIVDGDEADAAGIPADYRGLDRFEARKKIEADFEALDLLVEIEKKKIEQPFGDRSGVVIEPWLTDQWYVNAEELAKPAIEAVRSGATKFVPENWTKTYYNWMDNIQPWCISRQLWWGHRIPAWFGPDTQIFVGPSKDLILEKAVRFYADKYPSAVVEIREDDEMGPGIVRNAGSEEVIEVWLQQDPDVLDTWFSSALWPFSTQGWPDDTAELKQYYPTSVLVTAHDIIFFWVARMMMMGLKFMDEIPFHDVYIHALVLDEKGQKMSKSKGNVMDPLDIVDEYGADALRFNFLRQAAQGRNIRLSKQAVEGYRNFTTKLWNATRFAEMNKCEFGHDLAPGDLKLPLNRWIAAELAKCAKAVTSGLEGYKFNEASDALYQFIWNVLCDWYIELIKPVMNGDDEAAKAETRKACGWVIDQTLKLLHPFTPFVTEALWEQTEDETRKRPGFLMMQDWPTWGDAWADADAEAELQWVLDTISDIRSTRSVLNVPAGAQVPASLIGASANVKGWASANETAIRQLARLSAFGLSEDKPARSVTIASGEDTIALEVEEFITPADEIARLDKEMAKLSKDIEGTERKLSNEAFVSKAPPEIVEENRERIIEWSATLAKLSSAREQLASIS